MVINFIGISLKSDLVNVENSLHNGNYTLQLKLKTLCSFIIEHFKKISPNNNYIYVLLFPEYTFSNNYRSYIDAEEKEKILKHISFLLDTDELKSHNILFIASTIPSSKIYNNTKHTTKYTNHTNFLKSNPTFLINEKLVSNRPTDDPLDSIDYKIKNSLYVLSGSNNGYKNFSTRYKPWKNHRPHIFKYSKISPFGEFGLASKYNASINTSFFQSGDNTQAFEQFIANKVTNGRNTFSFYFSICADFTSQVNRNFFNFKHNYISADPNYRNECVHLIFSDIIDMKKKITIISYFQMLVFKWIPYMV